MELERKFARAGAPALAGPVEGATALEGYASVFGERDGGGDVVMPGAYAASLARLKAAGRRVKMLWQHDPAQPIGVWDEVVEDVRGLKVRGRLLAEVERGREALALIGCGAIDGLSIGYRTVRSESLKGGGRRLLELDLWEVSLVTFPMGPTARVAAKASEEAEMAAALREAGRLLAVGRDGRGEGERRAGRGEVR